MRWGAPPLRASVTAMFARTGVEKAAGSLLPAVPVCLRDGADTRP